MDGVPAVLLIAKTDPMPVSTQGLGRAKDQKFPTPRIDSSFEALAASAV
jgi:hypothetical protein